MGLLRSLAVGISRASACLALLLATNGVARGQSPAAADCWPNQLPMGALPPVKPIWCLEPLNTGPVTFSQGPNSWLDDFQHNLSNATLGDGYRVFDAEGSVYKSEFFRHNNHWMVDIAGHNQNGSNGPFYNFGGATMRPDRSFRFEGGKLVVEADVAAGIQDYADAWPELVVTTAPAPTGKVVDDLYSYGLFGGNWTVGCRLQHTRVPICAMYDDSGRGVGNGGRQFEVSFFQPAGGSVEGGSPSGARDLAWRTCSGTDPDANCRDRFRWELTADTLTLYVNGVLYMQNTLAPDKHLPDALLNGDVYVYFSSWIYKPNADTVRFHWAHLAVNPDSDPTPAPDLSARASPIVAGVMLPGVVAARGQEPGSNDPSNRLVSTATFPVGYLRFNYVTTPLDAPLNGEYPDGVIDWGTDVWHLASPWRSFTTNSINFNGAGTTASFTFLTPWRLLGLDAYNTGDGPTTVTLSCVGQPDVRSDVAAGEVTSIDTAWTGPCSTVTLSSSNGWHTNFTNLRVQQDP